MDIDIFQKVRIVDEDNLHVDVEVKFTFCVNKIMRLFQSLKLINNFVGKFRICDFFLNLIWKLIVDEISISISNMGLIFNLRIPVGIYVVHFNHNLEKFIKFIQFLLVGEVFNVDKILNDLFLLRILQTWQQI